MRNNDQSPIVVSIVSLAYNHAKYIRQCLDGFIMQKTNFAFEVLIHDDASTDGTADIIREYELKYPNIIKPIYQTENQYQKGVAIGATYLYPRVQGKYIAECEGDDYWIDPLKLQKQVDLLEQNPEYSFCCGGYIQRQEGLPDLDIVLKQATNHFFKFTKKDWAKEWFTMPLTIVYKSNLLYKYIELANKCKYTRDAHLVYSLLDSGDGIYLSDKLAVYNVHLGGISSMKSPYTRVINAYNCYKELYLCTMDGVLKQMYIDNIALRIRSIEEKNINILLKEGVTLSSKHWLNLFTSVIIHYIKRILSRFINRPIF